MKKWAYLNVYFLPVLVLASFNLNGILTFLPTFIFFGLLPLLELITNPDHTPPENIEERKQNKYFDILLYLAVPVQVGLLFYFFYKISHETFTILEYIGITQSMGLMCGVFGINIAHELGHRPNKTERLLAEILLLTSLEMHFIPYHNNGHHFNVATPNDPATARKGEMVYAFWFRSQLGSYVQAW